MSPCHVRPTTNYAHARGALRLPGGNALRHYLECPVLCCAASQAGGPARSFCVVLAEYAHAEWRQVATAAEVYRARGGRP